MKKNLERIIQPYNSTIQNIRTFPSYYLYDNSTTSPGYFNITVIPTEFCIGKNSIKLSGTSNLKPESEIYIYATDEIGNIIPYDIPDEYDIAKRRTINFYIGTGTPPGNVYIKIYGTAITNILDDRKIPYQWLNKTNLIWTTVIPLQLDKIVDDQPLFTRDFLPKISGSLKLIPQIDNYINATSSYEQYNAVYPYKYYYKNSPEKNTGANQILSTGISSFSINTNRQYTKAKNINNTCYIDDKEINAEFKYCYDDYKLPQLVFDQSENISRSFNNGIAYIEISNGYPEIPTNYTKLSSETIFTSSIYYVLNDRTLILNEPFKVNILTPTGKAEWIYRDADVVSASIIYTPAVTASFSDTRFKTVLVTDINNICTDKGKAQKVKVYSRPKNSMLPYTLVYDGDLESTNFFVWDYSGSYNVGMGEFWNYEFNENWSVQWYDMPPSELYYSNNILYNSVTNINEPINDAYWQLTYRGTPFYVLYPNNAYQLIVDAVYYAPSSSEPGDVQFFMSGSIFPNDVNIGHEVGHIKLEQKEIKYYKDLSFIFVPEVEGWAAPVIRVNAGRWYFSNIRIQAYEDVGVNPSHIKINLPVLLENANDILEYKFEFYGQNGYIADQTFYIDNIHLSQQYFSTSSIVTTKQLNDRVSGYTGMFSFFAYSSSLSSNIDCKVNVYVDNGVVKLFATGSLT